MHCVIHNSFANEIQNHQKLDVLRAYDSRKERWLKIAFLPDRMQESPIFSMSIGCHGGKLREVSDGDNAQSSPWFIAIQSPSGNRLRCLQCRARQHRYFINNHAARPVESIDKFSTLHGTDNRSVRTAFQNAQTEEAVKSSPTDKDSGDPCTGNDGKALCGLSCKIVLEKETLAGTGSTREEDISMTLKHMEPLCLATRKCSLI